MPKKPKLRAKVNSSDTKPQKLLKLIGDLDFTIPDHNSDDGIHEGLPFVEAVLPPKVRKWRRVMVSIRGMHLFTDGDPPEELFIRSPRAKDLFLQVMHNSKEDEPPAEIDAVLADLES